MVYITNSNLKSIESRIKIKEWENREKYLNEKVKEIFSEYEQKEILISKELANISNLDLKKLKEVMIEEKNGPAYHCDLNCEYMYHNYEAIFLPKNLKKCNISEKEYKEWLNGKENILKKDYPLFVELQMKKFGSDLDAPKSETRKNSGSTFYEAKNGKLELKIRAKKIIGEIHSKIPKHFTGVKIAKKSYQTSSNYKQEPHPFVKLNQKKFEEIHKLKKELQKAMKSYYILDKNPELNYEENILKELGFKPCKVCHSDYDKPAKVTRRY